MFKSFFLKNKIFVFVFCFSLLFVCLSNSFLEQKNTAIISSVFLFLVSSISYNLISKSEKVFVSLGAMFLKMILTILFLVLIFLNWKQKEITFSTNFTFYYILLYFVYSGVFYYSFFKKQTKKNRWKVKKQNHTDIWA